jgi:2-C-methyl-D-erythritol 2,4-cyclodiphosphate synthase
MRIGTGWDVHRLVADRKLFLGGVEIPFELGLLGHSDADVLLHAICDAMLGAAALGDIGKHFPDTSSLYKDISSLILLQQVKELISKKGFIIANIDCTVVAQEPKLASFIPEMILNISQVLGVRPDQVNIKATTTEGLGYEGKGKGISAQAVVLIESY